MERGSYLLVEQGPEHGQRDVEEEHPEDHLDLRNQEFLVPSRRRENKSVFACVYACVCIFFFFMRSVRCLCL